MRENMAILELTLHHHDRVDETSHAKAVPRQVRQDMESAAPVHQPTPAECYGCVDWFHF
jgi:hypothetical protein